MLDAQLFNKISFQLCFKMVHMHAVGKEVNSEVKDFRRVYMYRLTNKTEYPLRFS